MIKVVKESAHRIIKIIIHKRWGNNSYRLDIDKAAQEQADPLFNIKDGYPKLIIARTHQEAYSIEGVNVMDIADRPVRNYDLIIKTASFLDY